MAVAPDLAVDVSSQDAGIPDAGLPETLSPEDTGLDLSLDLGFEIHGPTCEAGEGCFLDPCTENVDCLSGWCVEHMGDTVCSKTCQEECPQGWACKQVGAGGPDVVFICVSGFSNLCKPCVSADACKAPGGAEDVCVSYGGGENFCGGACDTEAGAGKECPWGFSCQGVTTVDGLESTQCVADAGECPCTAASAQLSLWTGCELENEWGVCTGMRVCEADGLSPCDAAVPAEEVCNGLDDDCDGDVDEPEEVGGDYVNLCDDGNPCTADSCGDLGVCLHTPAEGDCDDGNACTEGDECGQAECQPGPEIVCPDDGNVCTVESCDSVNGCGAEILPDCCGNGVVDPGEQCDDGNLNNNDSCSTDCIQLVLDVLVPGNTEAVVETFGLKVRCVEWSGDTCINAQVLVPAATCAAYANKDLWHISVYGNDSEKRNCPNWCALATNGNTGWSTCQQGNGQVPGSYRSCAYSTDTHCKADDYT